jgi:putative glutathione S-transferase
LYSLLAVHFKTSKQRLRDYPNLYAYTRELYQMPGIKDTVDMFHIVHHYFESHLHINPFGIVPKGPLIDFDIPHGRDTQKYDN